MSDSDKLLDVQHVTVAAIAERHVVAQGPAGDRSAQEQRLRERRGCAGRRRRRGRDRRHAWRWRAAAGTADQGKPGERAAECARLPVKNGCGVQRPLLPTSIGPCPSS